MAEEKKYPTTAGEYKLLEECGQGVSATVYRALCIPFNEVVAVKVLDLEKCNSSLEEIRKEASTMSLINHPNVVKAYCSFVVEASLWVVMPFLAGGSCLHIMKAAHPEGFDEPVIATILKECLRALEYLHRHGHIHRDVKAGNILIDSNGSVKLADYGVSACMFDSGDRQRSRQTFVGTPCWMAPEVMEQVHGYDFRADIWSFGITALELAHGHAPFSKYPPMKVLLMTLQNAPPSLDYPQDKRFSKSFKEMIGLCLVKDPSKRPTAEKLLKHSFFKHARSADYLQRHLMEGLPPLGERVRALKAKDAARRAQAKVQMAEQEEKSNNEYKRGVSSWNFDLEDLKQQAAMMEDDESPPPPREEPRPSRSRASSQGDDYESPPGSGQLTPSTSADRFRRSDGEPVLPPVKEQLIEGAHLLAGAAMKPRPAAQQTPVLTTSSSSRSRAEDAKAKLSVPAPKDKPKHSMSGPLPVGRSQPKHIGRFDVFEDDYDKSPDWRPTRERIAGTQAAVADRVGLPPEALGASSRPAGEPRIYSVDRAAERERTPPLEARSDVSTPYRGVGGDGPLVDARSQDHRGVAEHRLVAEVPPERRGSERDREQRSKAAAANGGAEGVNVAAVRAAPGAAVERPPSQNVVRKGRFSVTEETEYPGGNIHKSASVGDWGPEREKGGMRLSQTVPNVAASLKEPSTPQMKAGEGTPSVPVAALIPHLQSLMHHACLQQDAVMTLINSLGASDLRATFSNKNFSRTVSSASGESGIEMMTDREREYFDKVCELTAKVTALQEEQMELKQRNSILERKLNAIYNEEEERRIQREEEAAEADSR